MQPASGSSKPTSGGWSHRGPTPEGPKPKTARQSKASPEPTSPFGTLPELGKELPEQEWEVLEPTPSLPAAAELPARGPAAVAPAAQPPQSASPMEVDQTQGPGSSSGFAEHDLGALGAAPAQSPGSHPGFAEGKPGAEGKGLPQSYPPQGRERPEEGRTAQCSACLQWFVNDNCKCHIPEGVDPAHDWQAKDLDRFCWTCERIRTGEDPDPKFYNKKLWVKENNIHKALKIAACKEHYTMRVRCVKYELAKQDIGDQNPGETKNAWRARILLATVTVSAQVALAYIKASREQKDEYLRACIRFQKENGE